ncbi:hypothetical protein DAPPUDRAFT_116539 [Daphnia pulex]|uniref:Uncharacterized protein n=1 Tax=Daphnia pulex TaxID=6669 RepID=E9HPQ3_DAPPU|nr:hypothetical protein DAPPUDRAFT_116539 [Daphnia pulex]|eukprot:EFX66297.1 hypothetical protein DAPPUDRAFT_116539 [Daphnia pulex]
MFKIACVLLLAVAAQTQLIGVYAGYPSLLPAATDAAPSRAKRQVADVWQKILKDGPRWGRSVNEMIEPETSPDTLEKSIDAAPSRNKRQLQLGYLSTRRNRVRTGRSLINEVEPTGTDYEMSSDADSSRNKRQLQLGYLSTRRNRGRTGRSLINEVEPTGTDFESVDVAPSSTTYQTQLQYGGNRPGRSLNNLSWSTA